jgi:serine/threonine-protein phosphatase PP1 catalytic subunit
MRTRPLSQFAASRCNDTLDLIIAGLPSPPNLPDLLTARFLQWLLSSVLPVFESSPNVVHVASPVHISGDLHGQLSDLISILRLAGVPPSHRLLFLGDYVDRGKNSVEVMALLFCLKLRFPEEVTLLRGNHECREVTRHYGFSGECKSKYGKHTYRQFCQVFDKMPVCAVVDDRVFCVHGGIAPGAMSLEAINEIERFGEIPEEGPLCDLLGSDPDPSLEEWGPSERGAAVCWGLASARKFLSKNGLEMIVRGHEIADDGYEFPFEPERCVVTVFSASCSPDEFTNKGCFMTIENGAPPKFTVLPFLKPGGRSPSRKGAAKSEHGGPATAKRAKQRRGKLKRGKKVTPEDSPSD